MRRPRCTLPPLRSTPRRWLSNIKAMIPIVLDLASTNYTKWKALFLNTLSKYELTDHVLIQINEDAATDPYWGILTITEYCPKLKSMADGLADLGHPMEDRIPILSVLQGLNKCFEYMAALIKRQRPFPSFVVVCSDLELEEINMLSKAPPLALVAAPTTATPPTGGGAPSTPAATSPSAASPSGGTTPHDKGRGRGKGRGRRGPVWPTTFNPMTGTFQVWPSY
ncbi:uncharacterized protein [Miscanthus floridulus]|uniref:uncharacterized protein n=1 Tax=Miscanthus floridulus TaxID=154761 RepID=UPI003459FCC5